MIGTFAVIPLGLIALAAVRCRSCTGSGGRPERPRRAALADAGAQSHLGLPPAAGQQPAGAPDQGASAPDPGGRGHPPGRPACTPSPARSTSSGRWPSRAEIAGAARLRADVQPFRRGPEQRRARPRPALCWADLEQLRSLGGLGGFPALLDGRSRASTPAPCRPCRSCSCAARRQIILLSESATVSSGPGRGDDRRHRRHQQRHRRQPST